MSLKKKIDMPSEEIQALLEKKADEMTESQRNGNYVEAQNCRIAIEQLKKDYQTRKLYEFNLKQKQEAAEIDRTHHDELDSFNKFWDKKMEDYAQDGQKMESQMIRRHEEELKETRENLQAQLPTKIKESSELLNLRKMEEHMSKQKNFAEAHKVQVRCSQLEQEETIAWMNNRNIKIETALNKQVQKQEHELQVLQKKIRTGLDELAKDRKREEERLRQKYFNVCKQLKMQHDKELIAVKGQFKSKGGQNSPIKSRTFFK